MATTEVRPALTIEGVFEEKRPKSLAMNERARRVLPDGIEHDQRIHKPFPVYMERSDSAYKWDLDGNRYIDLVVGHGALLLGHNHPVVMGKVAEQIRRGTHFGASHENMIRWGEWVCNLVPSAEMVRFFSSGTEATMMAMRLARNLTGKNKILKFDGHFHGWHDLATVAVYEPYEIPTSGGIPQQTQDLVVSIPQGDAGAVRDTIIADGDIAVVILEPSGASWGTQPTSLDFMRELRQVCTDLDVPLIFDEVITGFRYSPGGYQAEFGITPDMTTMAKIIAGGMPGGAVAGQRRFLEQIGSEWPGGRRVSHPGTYNANPVSSIAGATCLEYISDGKVHEHVNKLGDKLRAGINGVFARQGIRGSAYGSHSFWHTTFTDSMDKGSLAPVGGSYMTAMLVNGVHMMGGGGMLSEAHSEDDVDFIIDAFDKSVTMLKDDGHLS